MDREKMILDIAQHVVKVVEDMRRLSDSVQTACDAFMVGLSEEAPEAPKEIEEEPKAREEPKVSMEMVRGVLAQKSQSGFSAEVRAIIQKYGASRLSEIDPKDYAAVLKEAEGIDNE